MIALIQLIAWFDTILVCVQTVIAQVGEKNEVCHLHFVFVSVIFLSL